MVGAERPEPGKASRLGTGGSRQLVSRLRANESRDFSGLGPGNEGDGSPRASRLLLHTSRRHHRGLLRQLRPPPAPGGGVGGQHGALGPQRPVDSERGGSGRAGSGGSGLPPPSRNKTSAPTPELTSTADRGGGALTAPSLLTPPPLRALERAVGAWPRSLSLMNRRLRVPGTDIGRRVAVSGCGAGGPPHPPSPGPPSP